MLRVVRILVGTIAALLAAGLALLFFTTSPDGWSDSEIADLTAGLNEAAAVGVPHGHLMDAGTRRANASLLEKVEAGTVLTSQESAEYRKIYQQVLLDSQAFLARFDGELSVVPDHAMQTANNTDGMGIAGRHDHHDLSARRNFAGLLASLNALDKSRTPLGRIRYANAANKDLVDLISHLGVAPHSVSVPYQQPDKPWTDAALGADFEAMLSGFKSAQFEDVNSPAYWSAVDGGLASYDRLIGAVQARILADTSPWERRIAGRFLSPQTLAPPVDLDRKPRR